MLTRKDSGNRTTARYRTVEQARRRWLCTLVAFLLIVSLPLAVGATGPAPKPSTTGPKPPGKPQSAAAAKLGPQVSGAIIAVPGSGGDACVANALPANDDGSTDLVPISFTANLFGTSYSQLYVNNNGNVTFDQSLPNYAVPALGDEQRHRRALFADVDTRGTSLPTTYGAGTYNGHPTFCVDWVNVGYYSVTMTS